VPETLERIRPVCSPHAETHLRFNSLSYFGFPPMKILDNLRTSS